MQSMSVPMKTNQVAVNNLRAQVSTRLANPTDMWGVAPWGIPTLDKLTGGIQPYTMTVLGARPKVGKSALAGEIALNVARYFQANQMDLWVKVILFEMKAEVFLRRIAASMSGVSSVKVMSGNLTTEQADRYWQALADLETLPLVYSDEQGDYSAVHRFLTDKSQKVGFFILDHVGLFKEVGQNAQYQTGAMVSATNYCMRLCHELAPGLIIAHMGRGSEKNADKRPTLSDYAGTDSLGKNADLGLALHRPWLYQDIPEEDRNNPQPAELLMLAHREGPTKTINMIYNPKLTKYDELPDSNEVGDD